MKKNGFVFVETIVILVIVILALTLFLSSYFLLTRKSKARDYYNLPNDKYLLYNISNIWSLGNQGTNAYLTNTSFVIDKDSCSEYISKYDGTNECQQVFLDTNLERYAVIYNIDSAFKNNSISSISGMTSDVLEYLKTIKRKDGSTDLSYVVGVFVRKDNNGKNNKYYASLVFNTTPKEYDDDDNSEPTITEPSSGEYILTSVDKDMMQGYDLIKLTDDVNYSNGVLKVTTKTGGVRFPRHFIRGNKYYVTYKIQKTAGTLYSIGGKTDYVKNLKFYIDGVESTKSYNVSSSVTNITNDTDVHTIKAIFTTDTSASKDTSINFYIQPNRHRTTSVTVNITDVHVYQVYSGPNVLAYNDQFSSTILPDVTNSLSNVNNMSGKVHLGWYKDEALTNRISVDDNFTSSTATIIGDNEALVFAKVVSEGDAPTYCILKASSTGVSFSKLKGDSYQISTSSSTPASYNNQNALTPLAAGTYYGHTKAGSETYMCSLKVVDIQRDGYNCTASGTKYYSGYCTCDNNGSTYDYICSSMSCSCSAGYTAYNNCVTMYRCPNGTTQTSPSCSYHISSGNCSEGYSRSTNYVCPKNTKRIDSTEFCVK